MSITVATTLHELHGLAGTYTAAGQAAVATTVRCQAGQSVQARGRSDRRSRVTAIFYLLTSAVPVQPRRDDLLSITAVGETWVGDYRFEADAEPTAANEWRCLCVREARDHTIATTAGSARRRS